MYEKEIIQPYTRDPIPPPNESLKSPGMIAANKFFSGTSNLVLPVLQPDYPPEFIGKSRLAYYASLFNSLEINSSFYKNPKATTVARWSESVPDYFQFTFKLSKAITHVKGLDFNANDIATFMTTINNAGNKKGCLLVQLPPSIQIGKIEQLKCLIETINVSNPKDQWKIGVEFRHNSWYEYQVYELLEKFKATVVLHDIPKSSNSIVLNNSGFVFIRFHGPEGTYRGSYAGDYLYRFAQSIRQWMLEGKTVYAYFNNTMGDALNNLQTLNKLVNSGD